MADFETPLQCIFSIPPISLGEVNLSGSLNVNNVSIPNTIVSHVQYLDIEDDLSTLFNTKQNNITSSTDLTCNSINNISSATLTYLDPTSSIQTQLNGKQSNITSSSDIIMHELTINKLNGITSATLTYLDPTSSIQNQLDQKTTLAGVQGNANTYTAQNTYSNYAPLCSVAPSINNNLCNKSYVDTQVGTKNSISDVLGNANHFTSTNIFDNLPSCSAVPSSSSDLVNKTYVDSGLSAKTTLTAVQSNNNTYTAQNEFDNYAPICGTAPTTNYHLANKLYVDGKFSALVSSAPTALDTLNELAAALGNDANFSTTITNSLGTKAGLSANNSFSGNNVFSGSDTFSNTNTFTGNSVYNGVTLSPAQMSNIQYCDVSSSLTSQLAAKQNTITNINTLTGYVAPVDLTTAQTIGGIKTFSSPPVMSGASITSGTITDSSLASTFLKTSTALSTYCDLSNAQTVAGIKTFSSPPVMSGASITSASIPNSALASTYLTTSSASSTYQPLLSSSVSAVMDLLTTNRICEKIQAVSGSSPYTLNYANGSVFYLSGTAPSTNFTCNITNIPTSGSTTQYTLTLIYNSSTACFCNTVSATDTASTTIVASGTPKYINNAAPTVANSSLYMQTFTVLSCFSTKYIITSVSTYN